MICLRGILTGAWEPRRDFCNRLKSLAERLQSRGQRLLEFFIIISMVNASAMIQNADRIAWVDMRICTISHCWAIYIFFGTDWDKTWKE